MSERPGDGGADPQQLSQALEDLQQRRASVEMELERRRNERLEITRAIEAIETLGTGSTVQVPLGGDAYVRAEVQEIDEIIVGLGADYSVERDQDGAVEQLERKDDRLEDEVQQLQETLAELEEQGAQLEQQVQQVRQQQLQQLQQQQGAGRGGDQP